MTNSKTVSAKDAQKSITMLANDKKKEVAKKAAAAKAKAKANAAEAKKVTEIPDIKKDLIPIVEEAPKKEKITNADIFKAWQKIGGEYDLIMIKQLLEKEIGQKLSTSRIELMNRDMFFGTAVEVIDSSEYYWKWMFADRKISYDKMMERCNQMRADKPKNVRVKSRKQAMELLKLKPVGFFAPEKPKVEPKAEKKAEPKAEPAKTEVPANFTPFKNRTITDKKKGEIRKYDKDGKCTVTKIKKSNLVVIK